MHYAYNNIMHTHIAEEPRKENGGELGARPEDGSSGPCWWGGVVGTRGGAFGGM